MNVKAKVKGLMFGVALTTFCFGGVGCNGANSAGASEDALPEVTVEYYFEGLEADDYVKDESKTVVQDADYDTTVGVSKFIKKYNGFTYVKGHADAVNAVTISKKGDNTLKLYYDRNEYDVTFNDASASVTESYKFGSPMTPLTTPQNTDQLTFQGWRRDWDYVDFQDMLVEGESSFTAVYSKKESQVIYDFENDVELSVEGYKKAERSNARAHSGEYSFKLTTGDMYNYLYVPVADAQTFDAVQCYSFYLYMDSSSFKDSSGKSVAAPKLIKDTAYSIKRIFVFDTSLSSISDVWFDDLFDNQMILSAVEYDQWIKVTVIGTQTTDGQITLSTINGQMSWLDTIWWEKNDFDYDLYIDDITVEGEITSMEVRDVISIINQIEMVKMTASTSDLYEGYLNDTYAAYNAFNDKQKEFVHNWSEFLALYNDYFQN